MYNIYIYTYIYIFLFFPIVLTWYWLWSLTKFDVGHPPASTTSFTRSCGDTPGGSSVVGVAWLNIGLTMTTKRYRSKWSTVNIGQYWLMQVGMGQVTYEMTTWLKAHPHPAIPAVLGNIRVRFDFTAISSIIYEFSHASAEAKRPHLSRAWGKS